MIPASKAETLSISQTRAILLLADPQRMGSTEAGTLGLRIWAYRCSGLTYTWQHIDFPMVSDELQSIAGHISHTEYRTPFAVRTATVRKVNITIP